MGLPSRCARPQPATTINVCPSGCVCYAVRAPGSNVTIAPATRAGELRWNGESIRTDPVNHSTGPRPDGWVPFLLMSMSPAPTTSAPCTSIQRTGQLAR